MQGNIARILFRHVVGKCVNIFSPNNGNSTYHVTVESVSPFSCIACSIIVSHFRCFIYLYFTLFHVIKYKIEQQLLTNCQDDARYDVFSTESNTCCYVRPKLLISLLKWVLKIWLPFIHSSEQTSLVNDLSITIEQ